MSRSLKRFVLMATGVALSIAGLSVPATAATAPTPPGHGSGPLVLPLATDAGATSKPGTVTVGVGPAAATTGFDQRKYFEVGATAGSKIDDQVAFVNYSPVPVTIAVYATDAIDTRSGQFSLLAANQKPQDLGAWLTLSTTGKLHIPARSQVVVPFALAVPAQASPGDHAAGIVASVTGVAQDPKGAKVKLDQRVATRVYVRVSGQLKPQLSIVDVRLRWHGNLNPLGEGSVDVSYGIRNTGNVRLGAHPSVRLSSIFGGGRLAGGQTDITEVLPGSTIPAIAHFSGVLPLLRLRAAITAAPFSEAGAADPKLVDASATVSTWAVPWTLIGLLVLVGLGGWRWRRNRRLLHRARPLGPSRPARAAQPVAVGAVLLLALSALLVVSAAAPQRAAAATSGGALTFSPVTADVNTPIDVDTDGQCPQGATGIVGRISGVGFTDDKVVIGNEPVENQVINDKGGYHIAITDTLQQLEQQEAHPVTLKGRYDVTLECVNFTQSYASFVGSLQIDGSGHYSTMTLTASPVSPRAYVSPNTPLATRAISPLPPETSAPASKPAAGVARPSSTRTTGGRPAAGAAPAATATAPGAAASGEAVAAPNALFVKEAGHTSTGKKTLFALAILLAVIAVLSIAYRATKGSS